MKIFCVIPAYNEADSISQVLQDTKPHVDQIVVVDDGSRDDTFSLAQAQGVIVLHHATNRGQGAALRTGTIYALRNGADIIVHFDADGQFLPEDIAEVVAPLKSREADVVFGSRFLGKKSNMPFVKKFLIMPLARAVNKYLFGVTMTDPQSGFRAFDRAAALRFAWQQDGMAHASEILHSVCKAKLRIKEVPITVIYHEFGQRLSGGFKILKDLFIAKLIKH